MVTDKGQLAIIPGMEVADVLKVLASATPTYKVMGKTNYEVSTGVQLKVTESGVQIVVPVGAEWKKYDLLTEFKTTTYGTLTLKAVLGLSYPVANFLQHEVVRWSGNKYFVEYEKPIGNLTLTIEDDLNTGFKIAKDVTCSYTLLGTVDADKNLSTPNTTPDGVTLKKGKLSFSKYVDPSLISIEVRAEIENVVVKTETFGVKVTYPVQTAFETIASDKLLFKKVDIIAGNSFTWSNTLQLKDRYGRDLLNMDKKKENVTTEGGQFIGEFEQIYGLRTLKFKPLRNYVKGDVDKNQAIQEANILVNETTGELELNSKVNLTKPVIVEIQVSVNNKYGTSTSVYMIEIEATE